MVIILLFYTLALSICFLYGIRGFLLIYLSKKYPSRQSSPTHLESFPFVTIQLPVYNESRVVGRLLDSIVNIEYPKDRFEIQVLDDSTDETTDIISDCLRKLSSLGVAICHIRRSNRKGFKAGALRNGMNSARGEFIAIFDADFIPPADFLNKTLSHFNDPLIGMVQCKWGYLNGNFSLLTRCQEIALDTHFTEQEIRYRSGLFFGFNGSAGIWRKKCIEDVGNWHMDTLTEDLDLSYRAQMSNWKFYYRGDIESPGEIPFNMSGFFTQQYRWVKGSIQTARKLLFPLWTSTLPFKQKLQGSFHLLSNISFVALFIVIILQGPIIYFLNNGIHQLYFSIIIVFLAGFAGNFLFHLYSRNKSRYHLAESILRYPSAIALYIGISYNCTLAVIHALRRDMGEFTRTPKFGEMKFERDKNKEVRLIEKSLFCYMVILIYFSFSVGVYGVIPFLLLFAYGFFLTGFPSISERLNF